jgi:hypothetical protein
MKDGNNLSTASKVVSSLSMPWALRKALRLKFSKRGLITSFASKPIIPLSVQSNPKRNSVLLPHTHLNQYRYLQIDNSPKIVVLPK